MSTPKKDPVRVRASQNAWKIIGSEGYKRASRITNKAKRDKAREAVIERFHAKHTRKAA